ncbi:rCG55988 [Rattus norvegicus]|uniref:RCG55988 n=1 Tax=Rattus norvegicus TaxID=10116 RepID=A6IBK5_RAT|nr:rCG55988 [Rattus norvegicus]
MQVFEAVLCYCFQTFQFHLSDPNFKPLRTNHSRLFRFDLLALLQHHAHITSSWDVLIKFMFQFLLNGALD